MYCTEIPIYTNKERLSERVQVSRRRQATLMIQK